ncbi:TonB-dependent receptor [Neptunicella marina]|uniref:TonB-dependent receptor n=1 Tax=Neptunicella marina TaxID=2125989 RepID=A0A8J6ITG7_9ALTE|nr:TonB-dependent receptor [Neptunicella marina]MBC3765602.1 TonB-dependent receptor [Neptunicella marina]
MMNKTAFKPALISLAVASACYSGLAISQEQNNNNDEVEVISVKGMRGSLIRSQAIKMDNTSIVEAISAEDIGKLPDSSIAESLARLPGLAGERRNGRTSGISVRGFKEDYVGTTLNGRELLGIGDNRGVEYDLYPSEMMTGAVIYKTPDATLAAMGIGGTVDLQTARPLNSAPTLTLNASAETNSLDSPNPDYSSNGHRYALSFSDKFADDTVGLAVTIATTESPLSERQFSAWGYSQSGPNGEYQPDGHGTFARSSVLERDTISAVFQYAPSDKFNMVVDALHIDFTDGGIQRGFIEALPAGTQDSIDGNIVTSGTTSGWHSTIRHDPVIKEGTLKSFGLNLEYHVNDSLELNFDMAMSETDKSDLRGESYSGVGRSGLLSQGDKTIRSWELTDKGLMFTDNNIDFSDYGIIKLAGTQSWGGSMAPLTEINELAASLDPALAQKDADGNSLFSYVNAQDGFNNKAIFGEELDTYRLDGKYTFADGWISSITAGLMYKTRSKFKENYGEFATAPQFPLDGPIPESARRGVADLTWAGLGYIVAYDAQELYDTGYYKTYSAFDLETDRIADTYTIDEKITTAFVKADIESEVGGIPVIGNMGLQVIRTDQSSTGFDGVTGPDKFVIRTAVEGGDTYTKVLPSVNLTFDLEDGHYARVAASKTISRARFDYLKPGRSIKYKFNVVEAIETQDPAKGPWEATSGNPTLRPLESNNLDVAYDWYYEDDGFISAAIYYKDLVNWHRAGQELIDFTPYYIEDLHFARDSEGVIYKPQLFQGYSKYKEDGLTGSVKGIELQASIPLRVLHKSLDGFGVVMSGSYNDGKLEDDGKVPGMSKNVYSFTGYYENEGFEFRIAATKRSEFESEERGGSNTLSVVNRQPVTLVDAQVSYDFAESSIDYLKGLKVSLQGINLTEENDINTLADQPELVTKSQIFGSSYILNVNYSF